MLYTYRCPKCEWKGDRVAKIAERDEQLCQQPATRSTTLLGITATEELARELDNELLTNLGYPSQCGALLDREIIALNSKMGYQWSNWYNGAPGK